MTERKREKKVSDPKLLAARMDRAHANGVPMQLEYDECTGVIDVALERARAKGDAAVGEAQAAIKRLGTSLLPKVPA